MTAAPKSDPELVEKWEASTTSPPGVSPPEGFARRAQLPIEILIAA